MLKVTAGYFHSVDGVIEAPFKWQFDAFDDELGAELGKAMSAIDTVLLGRVGYQEWAGYWPTAEADEDFAGFINNVPKFVASTTLKQKDLAWQNSTLIEGELEDFVRKLKAEDGVYMINDSRINVAGIPEDRVDELADYLIRAAG